MTPLDLADLRARLFTTVPVVADLLDLDERTVRRGIQRGELPAVRVGNTLRIPVAAVLRLAGIDPTTEAEPAAGGDAA
jgi:excisionase family DNA binding protein